MQEQGYDGGTVPTAGISIQERCHRGQQDNAVGA